MHLKKTALPMYICKQKVSHIHHVNNVNNECHGVNTYSVYRN